jgi:hypothetical protein
MILFALIHSLDIAPHIQQYLSKLHYYEHSHLRIDALARLPLSDLFAIGSILLQKLFLRAFSFSVLGFGAGAFRLEPVAALYLALPLAVKPAPFDTGNFSPLPTARTGFFLALVVMLELQLMLV